MSTTLEDALEEEAYARMVDDVISAHKDDIISDFVSERMKSYYLNNPHLTAPAEAAIEEAYKLIDVSPTASLVFSSSAIEITLRDVLLKPIAAGMVHDEDTGPLIADLVIEHRHFTKLLFNILENYGLNLKQDTRPGSGKNLWSEMEEIKTLRNKILHQGEKATLEMATLSLEISVALLHRLFPHLRKAIVGHLGRPADRDI